MSVMFNEAASFNQPLDSWDVSSVTDMCGMFYKATNFDQPLNSWDVSSVTNMADISEEIMKKNNLNSDDVAYLVPHQANKRIIDATAKRMGVGPEKVLLNIEKYGNTTAATIPLCLWDYEKKFKKGDNLILAAFGGGFTWGSLYLKWSYNN